MNQHFWKIGENHDFSSGFRHPPLDVPLLLPLDSLLFPLFISPLLALTALVARFLLRKKLAQKFCTKQHFNHRLTAMVRSAPDGAGAVFSSASLAKAATQRASANNLCVEDKIFYSGESIVNDQPCGLPDRPGEIYCLSMCCPICLQPVLNCEPAEWNFVSQEWQHKNCQQVLMKESDHVC